MNRAETPAVAFVGASSAMPVVQTREKELMAHTGFLRRPNGIIERSFNDRMKQFSREIRFNNQESN